MNKSPALEHLRRAGKRVDTAAKRLVGYYPWSGPPPLTDRDVARLYRVQESFTNYLPWVDYDADTGVFEFDDGLNVGVAFDATPVDVDGRAPDYIQQIEDNCVRALHALPQLETAPWVLQLFLQDEPILPDAYTARLKRYARPEALKTPHAEAWFEILKEHVAQLGNPQGLFDDPLLGRPWMGVDRRVRICLYRRAERSAYYHGKKLIAGMLSPAEQVNNAAAPFVRMLEQTGMKLKRLDGAAWYRWLLPWLSPAPTGYDSPYDYLKDRPYPADADRAYAFDLGAAVTTDCPRTAQRGVVENNGVYFFNGRPQRFISLQAIDSQPRAGLLTADYRLGKEIRPALWEQLPRNAVFNLTIVIRSKTDIDVHLNDLIKRTGSASYDQEVAVEQAHHALKAVADGKRLYSVFAGFFVRADTAPALHRDTLDAMTVLRANGLNPIDPKDDPIAQDSFIKALPMVFDPRFDRLHAQRSRLTYTHHIARLLPLYGRARGTGHPGIIAHNRAGETFEVDPYSKKDRKKVAHGLVFGPTGAGKSATVVNFSMHAMAMRKPRQFFIEKGRSFSLLNLWYRQHGLSTHAMVFTPRADISLPPYAAAEAALQQLAEAAALQDPTPLKAEAEAAVDFEDAQRDYLGEMELLTQLMITGADEKEYAKMTRQDLMVIQQAIVAALESAHGDNKPHPLVGDVADQLASLAGNEEIEARRVRIREMADDLRFWTTGLRGRFFNRYGQAWPEVDATFIDMGILVNDQYRDMLAVALISLVNAITGLGEKYQYDPRETEVTTDEGHVITKNPVLVKPFVFGQKTWRKLGIWLTQATQNLDDYPDQARPMLSLAEWWYCLAMPKSEIDDIARFRTLSAEEKQLLASATKEPGRYVEGVLLSDTLTSLFRVVMPGLALALAQTDPDEKVLRRQIATERGFTGPFAELEAAKIIGREITDARAGADASAAASTRQQTAA